MRSAVLATLVAAAVLAACSKKEPTPAPTPAAAAAPKAAAPKAAAPKAAAPTPAPAAAAAVRPDTVGATVGSYTKERVKVLAIDTVTRVVVLESEDGDTASVKVDPRYTRLNAVRPGDVFVAEYLEAVAVDIRKTGTGPAKMAVRDTIIRLPGDKPTGIAGTVVTATVEVVGIDLAEQEITIRTARMGDVPVQVDDPDVLSALKVGDHVDVTYVEALGISFEK